MWDVVIRKSTLEGTTDRNSKWCLRSLSLKEEVGIK